MTTFETYERAQLYFQAEDYFIAGELLKQVVDEAPGELAPRELLARAYYHSAQLQRAEEQLRWIVERYPTEAYALLMLARTLQRMGRRDEAEPWIKLAEAQGQDVSSARSSSSGGENG